ncbi:MAG TPA: EAL domain-containing protein [Paucimonas sp.]|nr:EAL domain-containing protein [Paucimonas sp.]HJW56617.1 EAL domain-containing protein [Burkholderiaceae bacterium]
MAILPRTISFKNRILVAVLTLFIAGIWGLTARIIHVLQTDLERQVANQLSATADYVASDIDLKIQVRTGMLEEIMQSITPALMADPAGLNTYLEQHPISHLVFPYGIFIVNKEGTNIADFPHVAGRVGASISDRPYFQEAMNTGRSMITTPFVGRYLKQPVVAIVLPIKDASGAMMGVLICGLDISSQDLFGRLERIKLGKTGAFLVISLKEHIIISASDKKRIMQPVPVKGVDPVISKRLEHGFEDAAIVVTPRGEKRLTVARTIKAAGWMVIAGITTEEAFSPIVTLKREVYLASLLLTLTLAVALHFLLRRQLAPLGEAGAAMRRMTKGDAPFAPLPIRRQDEIGELMENFNQLAIGRSNAEQQIKFLAYHDTLTGLPNRLLAQDRFEQAAAHAGRTGTQVALLFLDLDHFKTINDSLGHASGDALLKEIAVRLGECVRDTDTCSRQGGDEFLIVLPELHDADTTAGVLLKIMEKLQAPFEFGGQELATTASIGIAIYPDDGENFDTLLKKADTAMYRAKEAGRSTYRFFDEQMNIEAVEHLSTRNGLRKALERDEFVLYYQPQVDLASGAVVGAEALIRWNHPKLGLVAPAKFISVAEDSGLIVPIGEWVMREACRQGMAWKKAGLPDIRIAVNLSAVQFKRGNLEQTIVNALQESGFDPACLELEITESLLIQNVENVLASIKRLKQLGVTLSIDDFGTGYSSLSYLKRFAVDKLKIDRSFVRDIATDPDDAAIVHAIIQMGRSLNLKIIAEGVEDEAMLERLRRFRCDEAQGYYFARPMPADEFARHLTGALAYQD